MSQEQDQHYIDRIINGDASAFAILVDRYKHMVYTLAVRILKNEEEAEEVAQDTFLKVYGSLKKFKGNSKFSTWVYKITYHRSLDYLKKRKTNLDTQSIDNVSMGNMRSPESVFLQFEQDDKKKEVKAALDELPGEDGTIIMLYYYEELSLKEISKVMKINDNVAKVKLFRARKKLAELLKYRLEPEIIQGYGSK